jgi:23S rRNA (guanosine2251-2'-O)-methyltransferase
VHAVLAALANPARRPERIIATRAAAERLPAGLKADIAPPETFASLLGPNAVHQGLALKCPPLEPYAIADVCDAAAPAPVLILDQVTDPQNVGALFRSAAAFGACGVVMQDRHAPPLTGALAKAAAGAIEIVPEVRVVNIARAVEQLGALGYLTIALDGAAEIDLAEAVGDPRPKALVIGAEGEGVRRLVAEACGVRARIPMSSAMESLNASVAGAIALYEARARG